MLIYCILGPLAAIAAAVILFIGHIPETWRQLGQMQRTRRRGRDMNKKQAGAEKTAGPIDVMTPEGIKQMSTDEYLSRYGMSPPGKRGSG